MKKMFLFIFALALFIGPRVVFAGDEGPYLPLAGGGTMVDAPYIGLGGINGRLASITVPCMAMVTLSKGDVVVLATSVTTTPMAVTKTATLGSSAALGVALADIKYGAIGQVVTYGIAMANIGIDVNLGDKLITSTTAGRLTSSACVSESLYTALSATALVGTAAQYRANDSTHLVRVFIGKR
jgi:hypothetical protein